MRLGRVFNKNISFDYVKKENSPTIIKTRFIETYSKTKLFGTYKFNDVFLNSKNETEVLSYLKKNIKKADGIIALDYGHGLITRNIARFLENSGIPLCINTQLNAANKGFHAISKYKQARFACIHEGELRHEFRNRDDD